MTEEAGARGGITTTDVRALLSDPKIFPDVRGVDDDDEFAIDSLGLVWFLHQLELHHDVAIAPDEVQLSAFTSVRRITDYLAGVHAH